MSQKIRLDKSETALWNEVGTRGDFFRAAIRDRASAQVSLTKQMVEIRDASGEMLHFVQESDPVPEGEPAPRPPTAETVRE
jgi:hypothetical protein